MRAAISPPKGKSPLEFYKMPPRPPFAHSCPITLPRYPVLPAGPPVSGARPHTTTRLLPSNKRRDKAATGNKSERGDSSPDEPQPIPLYVRHSPSCCSPPSMSCMVNHVCALYITNMIILIRITTPPSPPGRAAPVALDTQGVHQRQFRPARVHTRFFYRSIVS